ncbi:MAG: spermidine/putrescine ABC transporter substrate-binding protein, partial [Acidimicrobiales bacterium]
MAEEQNNPIDLAWLRGLASQRMNRRDVLRLGGTAASAAGLGALLAACGVSGAGQTKKQSTSVVDAYWAKQKATKKFNFANWPLYIDVGSNPNDHPSIDMFEKKTGIHVKYSEVIQDDGPFFAQVQPSLQNHQYTGYDLAVITNGIYLTDFIDLGYLVPLDHSKLPNFEKYAGSIYKNPSYDPGN